MQKNFSMSFTAKKRKNNRLENKKKQQQQQKQKNQEEDLRQKKKFQSQNLMRAEKRQTKTRVDTTGLSIDDVKKLDNLSFRRTCVIWKRKKTIKFE